MTDDSRKLKIHSIISIVLRVLLCALFVVSALSKLVAIDHFELYIFSYGFLPLTLCYLMARLCIGAELVLALLIALGWFPRVTKLLTLGMLILFSLFLCYAALIGRNDSCQCFGDLADFDPVQSLLKNAVLIVLVLLCYRLHHGKTPDKSRQKRRLWITAVAGIVLMVIPFVVSVPDNWMFGDEESRYNTEAFNELIGKEGELAGYNLTEGHHLVAFVTPGCPYCKMSRQKLGSIAERHGIDTSLFLYVQPDDITSEKFVEVTYGQRPLIMMLDSGKVVRTYHYRNISERYISRFLTVGR